MSVPASVQQYLEKQQVTFAVSGKAQSLTGHNQLLHEQRLRLCGAAKSLLFTDTNGMVQVVFPADCLLDVELLCQQTQRQLRLVSNTELQAFCTKYKVESVPALPQMGGVTTVVDRRLVDREQVLLDSGADELLVIKGSDFEALTEDAQIEALCQPLAELEQRLEACTDLETAIHSAVKSFTSKRVRQRLEETLELPPLPSTAQRIIKLRVDPNADISDLANIVEVDPSLAAQVVSWASSPYYSAPGKIKSIHDAIVRVLGFDMVLNLALGLSLGKALAMPKDGPMGASPYWQQAVYTAAVVEGLVTGIPREHRPGFGLAYLSGLLHNFGWLILAEVFPPHFSKICRAIEVNSHVSPHLVDFHYLGVTRDHLAAWLMELWQMPQEVVVALRLQNSANMQQEHGEYAMLLKMAQRLLQANGIGQGPTLEIADELFSSLYLDREKAQQTVENILIASDDLNNIVHQISA